MNPSGVTTRCKREGFTFCKALFFYTNEDIHNVTFRITYLDMKGNPLDYEDYSSEVEIAPGMTKKVNITAYESTREYSYYLSEDVPDYAHKFKIKFELTGYNTSEVTDGDAYYYKAGWIIALSVFGFLFVIGLYIGLYALVAVMAKRRHQFFRKRNVIVFVGRMS